MVIPGSGTWVTRSQDGSFVVVPGSGTFSVQPTTHAVFAQGGSFVVTAGTGTHIIKSQEGSFVVTPGSGTFSTRSQDGSYVVTPGTGSFNQGTYTVTPGTGAFVTSSSTQTLKSQSFSLTATGTIITAVASKRLRIYATKLNVSAAISVNFRDGATPNLEGAMALAANGGFVEVVDPPAFLFQTTSGNSLDLVMSGSGTAAGRVSYWEE